MKISKSQRAIYIAISILTAVIFWFYVDNTGSNERDIRLYNVPVTFVGAEDELAEHGLMIVSGDDAAIDLRLRGRRQVISRINRHNIEIQVDVSSILSTGSHTLNYSISYPDSVLSSSVTVVSASMYTVTIVVDELHTKTIDVVADVSGSLPDGYMLHECALTPSILTVSGTEEQVNSVDHALVKVTLNNTTASYSEYLGYDLIDADGNVITNTKHLRCSEDKVRVELPIVTLKEVPLDLEFIESGGSMEKDISCTISPKTITISGEESTLEKLDKIVLTELDLSQVMGDDTMEYEIPIPGGCYNESGTDTAVVTIKFNHMQTKTLACSNIVFINEPEGYTASAVTQSVNVTVRGRASELEKVTEQNVRVVADLSDMSSSSGVYTVRAKVYVDGAAEAGAIGTYQIGCRLQRS
ncbi:MAG TPA: hypothetical protein H9682_04750 [Firmicutes bacterium]|nr:hypothetical protein [Bacillota bacterium]